MPKYYGDLEVSEIKDAGEGSKSLVLSDGSSVTLRDEMIAETVTDDKTNASDLRLLRSHAVVKEILSILHSYNVFLGEIDFINNRVVTSMNMTLEAAEKKLWGVDIRQRSMNDVDRVLKADIEQAKADVATVADTAAQETAQNEAGTGAEEASPAAAADATTTGADEAAG